MLRRTFLKVLGSAAGGAVLARAVGCAPEPALASAPPPADWLRMRVNGQEFFLPTYASDDGQLWLDNRDNTLRVRRGGQWVPVCST